MLIVGAGVQGRAHLEAFIAGFDVRDVRIASHTRASPEALATHARASGAQSTVVDDPNPAPAHHPLLLTCTSAQAVALHGLTRSDAFVAAVSAFTPQMVEWAPGVVRAIAASGTIIVDTRDADHEAGDLLQAGLKVSAPATLRDVVRDDRSQARAPIPASMMFKRWPGRLGFGGGALRHAGPIRTPIKRLSIPRTTLDKEPLHARRL